MAHTSSAKAARLAEGTPCSPLSMLPCDQLPVAVPFRLDFEASEVGIPDINGLGTGFTLVDAYSGTRLTADGSPSDPSVPGYESSKLKVEAGKLEILTNKGIAYQENNNQLNSLGVRVDSRGKLQVETVLISPYAGANAEQAGLWFGLNDKTFVKLAVTANRVELRREINDVSAGTGSADHRITGTISGLNTSAVRLRLLIDPANATVQGFYSTDGTTFINVGEAYSISWLSIAGAGLTSSTAHAGIYATHRNGSKPVAYTFDNFSITAPGTSANPSTSSPLVSNLTSSTGKSYTVTALAVGARTYTDRTNQVTSVPAVLSGSELVQTANDDKWNTSTSLLSFNLSESATVYIAYDPRATALPSWLSGWQKLTDRVGVNDSKISYMNIYSKSFPAGTVSLGGNLQSPAAGAQNNYFVMAKATGSEQYTLSVSTTGSGAVTKNPNQATYSSGASVILEATPASGYAFSGWSGDATGTSNPLSVTMSGNKAITANFTQSQPSTGLISNISASSGRSYMLENLAVGAVHYTDRTYKITSVPASLSGAPFIRTANDDKNSTASSLLSFNLSESATVYVAYDPRATALPSWLSGWQKLTDRVGVNDSKISYMNIYSKSFPAGAVSLGGNKQSPAAGAENNYFVIAKAATTNQNQAPVANAGQDKTITLPQDNVTLDGSGTDTDGTVVNYNWSQESGPNAANFSSTTVARPTVSGLVAGSYTFSLVVRDDKDAVSAPDLVNVTVQSADTQPDACYPISMLACSQVQLSLPVNLTFGGSISNTVPDKNGSGTGFTMVDAYSGTRNTADGAPSNTNIPGYEPSKLTVASGKLQLVTNKGIAFLSSNNQLNALGVKVNSRGQLQVETTLINPYYGTASQQAGVWFGLNDKTYLKLAVTGNKVEMRREFNDDSGTAETDQRITSTISGLNNQVVHLRLEVDPTSGTAEGFYSTDGVTYVNVGQNYSTPGLSISGMGLTGSTVFTGIFATHRNGSSPVTYTFDDFSVKTSLRPYVTAVRPAPGATNVPLDKSVSVDLAFPSGKSINGNTVNTNTVKLYTVALGGGEQVTGTAVNATAAGDAITLSASLKPNTTYEFIITDQVKDGNGYAMIPFSSRFTTTGSVPETPTELVGVSFTEQILIDNSFGTNGFTSLAIGPDHRLYAATSEGKVVRWDIAADGTLTNQVTITLFGTTPRLLIGFRFDPAATRGNLVAWVSHSSGSFNNAEEWSSKISKIDLNDPANPQVKDYVINLPRSYKDHSVNSIDFGPDGALYVVQGSNTAMGEPDLAWGERPERLLSGAVLRLDIAKAEQQALPLNVKTAEGGTYNPYAAGAPLTIYASGVRNAYDLVWHTNGELYVPTNGSAAGGNTPALASGTTWSNGQVYSGADIAAMNDVRISQNDYLYRVAKGGYYGHPNTLRHEYILNGGNPTERKDPGEVVWNIDGVAYGYPVGTPIEPNFRGWAYDFGMNISPNGVIEYKSSAFGGKLKGKLLVCRFSGGDDLIVLEPGVTNKDIIKATEGIKIPGLRRPFANPLDVVEDVLTGNLYISEYFDGNGKGQPRITLLRADQTAVADRINAGGDEYTDSQNRTWGADGYSTGGVTASKSFDVAGTVDDQLYLHYRYASSGVPFSYQIPVSTSGSYTVKLHFLEPYFGAPGGKTTGLTGARVFHVDVEGQRVLSNFDIYAQEGAGKAIVKTYSNVSVTDGKLSIDFTSVKDNAIISAIEVIPNTLATAQVSAEQQDFESNASGLQIYPNPTSGGKVFVNIENFGQNEPVTVTVMDMAGRLIQSQDLVTDATGAGKIELTLDGGTVRGLYFIRAASPSASKVGKLLVQ
ncbi:malectin domain-containing carbohydrate-binding protein [Pontibacter russatus]|uniref:malectin domain-containing carbohydrate-binding protein n=1 Tax=Pontibacter russatus TaxID=2694929 RepID=UPI00137B4B2E|nr:malectin domain-containing carbohydrate-binding protein [Pontibacter russatus]